MIHASVITAVKEIYKGELFVFLFNFVLSFRFTDSAFTHSFFSFDRP